MNVYGFCAPVDGKLDLVDFFVENIQGLCLDLIPNKAPITFITNSPVPGKRKGTLMPLSYHRDGLGVMTDDSQAMMLGNVFVFDTNDIWTSFLKIEDCTALLIAMWQALLHEVRHFVQCQLPVVSSDLLTEEAIRRMAEISPRVGEISFNRLASYSHCEPETRKGEIDAIVVEALGAANFVASWGSRGDGEFDYDKVRQVLLMRADQFAQELAIISQFR